MLELFTSDTLIRYIIYFFGIIPLRYAIIKIIYPLGKAIFKLGGFYTKYQSLQGNVSKNTSLLEKLGLLVNTISTKIDLILTNDISVSNSPRKLNPTGVAISNNIKCIFDKYKNVMIEKLDKKESDTDYDIQIRALGLAKEMLDVFTDDEKKEIKDSAYQNGVSIQSVFAVFGFMLLDSIKQGSSSSQ